MLYITYLAFRHFFTLPSRTRSWTARPLNLQAITRVIRASLIRTTASVFHRVDDIPSSPYAHFIKGANPSRYHDGIREVAFIPGSNVRPLTRTECFRYSMERWLGHPLDWSPFYPLPPLCNALDDVVVSWKVSKTHVTILYPSSSTVTIQLIDISHSGSRTTCLSCFPTMKQNGTRMNAHCCRPLPSSRHGQSSPFLLQWIQATGLGT